MSLRYDESGTGLPVVLIHGFPLCRRMWRPQVQALSKTGCRVICPDLPGFGQSPPKPGVVSMDAYADAVMDLLDRLGIDRAVVGGMSMGGYVLLNMAERYPQRLAAALYIVTRAAADDPAGKVRRVELADQVRGGNRSVVPDVFEKLLFAPATLKKQPELVKEVRAWMDAASPEGVAAGLLAMRSRRDYLELLPELAVPALVIGAAQDLAVPASHAEALAAGLPDAELHILPNAGHMANLEQADSFNQIVLAFLQRRKLL